MNVARPLCSVCHRRHREPSSARCNDCGPGRLFSSAPPRRPRKPTPAQELGDTDETDEAGGGDAA